MRINTPVVTTSSSSRQESGFKRLDLMNKGRRGGGIRGTEASVSTREKMVNFMSHQK